MATRVSFSYGNATYIPFKNQAFDAVVAGSVLRLLIEAERRLTMKEMLRVLKDEGKLIILEITRTAKATLLYWLPAFFVFKTKEYWTRLLQESGLENVEITRIGDLALFCGNVNHCVNHSVLD